MRLVYFTLILMASSCAGLFGEREVSLARKDPENPANLTVNSSAPWVASFLIDSDGITPTSGNFSEVLSPPAVQALNLTLLGTPVSFKDSSLSPQYLALLPSITNPQPPGDATDDNFKIEVNITKADDSLKIACLSVAGVFSKAQECASQTFTLARNDISEVQVSIEAKQSLTSANPLYEQSIQASRLETNQISNTAGSANDDGVSDMVAYGDQLCFVGNNALGARKVFCGQGSQLLQVSDTSHGASSDDGPTDLIIFDDKLYFSAYDEYGATKLYYFDRNQVSLAANTRLDPEANDNPKNLFIFQDKLYFYAMDENYQWAMYRLGAGVLEKLLVSGDFYFDDETLPHATSHQFYAMAYIDGYSKLVSFDGSQFQKVIDLGGTSHYDVMRWMQIVGDHAYFVLSSTGKPGKLYLATTDGIKQISHANDATHDDFPIPPVVEFKNKTYFIAYGGQAYKIYQFDGAQSSIAFHTTADEKVSDEPTEMVASADELFLVAKDVLGVFKLQSFKDGALKIVADTRGNLNRDDSPSHLTLYNGRLYFVSNTAQSSNTCDGYYEVCNQKLHLYDPATQSAVQVSNSTENIYRGDNPQRLMLYDHSLCLTMKNSRGAQKVYCLKDLSAK